MTPLTAGVSYTFTVTATNSLGTSQPSAPSNAVISTAPTAGPPTNVNAIPGDSSALLSWSAPTDTGGQAITSYQITPYIGNAAQTSLSVYGSAPAPPPTNYIVTGLTNNTTYTLVVTAFTNAGSGAPSAPSNAVTPIQGGNHHPLAPKRILDTRDGTGLGAARPLGPGQSMTITISSRGGVPTSGVTAVVLNVTVTNTTAASYLTVWPAGFGRPLASNLNWTAGKTVPNLVEVALGTGGQSLTVS